MKFRRLVYQGRKHSLTSFSKAAAQQDNSQSIVQSLTVKHHARSGKLKHQACRIEHDMQNRLKVTEAFPDLSEKPVTNNSPKIHAIKGAIFAIDARLV